MPGEGIEPSLCRQNRISSLAVIDSARECAQVILGAAGFSVVPIAAVARRLCSMNAAQPQKAARRSARLWARAAAEHDVGLTRGRTELWCAVGADDEVIDSVSVDVAGAVY